MSRPRLKRLLIALAGLALLLVAAGVGFQRCRVGGEPSVATAVVERGRFVREVTAFGRLQAVKATPIIVPTEARRRQTIAELAPDGSLVKAGQAVVVFDASEATKDLADGRTERETAENKIAKTRAEGAKTRHALKLDVERAREDRERAEDVAPTEEGIFSRHEIIESRVDRGLLDRKTALAGQKLDTSGRLHAADVALGQIERGKAEFRIRQAELALKALTVTAPHDGLFVLERNWWGEVVSVGRQVWPGEKLGELPDLSELEAKVYVLEADAGGLAVGRRARLEIEGRPGREERGRVSRVDALAKPAERRSPVKYFETGVAFDRRQASASLHLGQKVRVRIVLEEADHVLLVPRGALTEKDGRRVVYRERGGTFQPVEVKVGALSVARAVIEAGLSAGERVALRDPSRPLGEILKARSASEASGASVGGQ